MNWHELFEYDDGKLKWKISCKKKLIGRIAGTREIGANTVRFGYKSYKIRRVVWEMFNGEIPPDYCVIHLDGDSFNDRIENLKLIKKNEKNARKNNRKFIGVYPNRYSYESRITINRQVIRLGNFAKEEDAAKAYDRALIKYGKFNAKFNFPLENYK